MQIDKRSAALMLTGAMLLGTFVSGCGKKEIDYNLNDNQGDKQGSTEGGLAGRLGIPESCDVSFDTGSSGLQSITAADDAIEIPNTDGMSVCYYEQLQIDNAYKQQLVETFLDKEQGIYERDAEHRIKSEIEAEIESVKQNQANMAEQGYTDSWYDEYIAELETELQTAPDEYPAAGDYSGSSFIGMMDGREYEFEIDEGEAGFGISAALRLEDVSGYRPYEGADHVVFVNGPSAEDFTENNLCQITQEEACDVAGDFLNRFGITDMVLSAVSVVEWEYFNQDYSEMLATEYDGYFIEFSRAVNNTPVYQAEIYDLDFLIMEDAWINMPLESFSIYVNDNGVFLAYWTALFEAAGEEETNAELMSWDEMIEAVNANIAAYYEKYPSNFKKIKFNDVRLSYYPVVDEDKGHSYKFIPVWVFSEYVELIDSDESKCPSQLLIVNAMDGTIIDLIDEAKKMGLYEEYDDSDVYFESTVSG